MEDRIKLIWDFHGPDSQKTAEHHVVHLNQFAVFKKLNKPVTGVENVSEIHNLAFMVVDKERMTEVRDALKPHRGTLSK